MEMRIEPTMRPEQRLVMTPRLQQALKLLELPTLEVAQRVQQELMTNPALEQVDELLDEEEATEERALDEETSPAPEVREVEEEPPAEPAAKENVPEEKKAEDPDPMDKEAPVGEEAPDWDEFLPEGADGDYRPEEREFGEEPYARVISRSVSFREHLEEQLGIATADPGTTRIADFIIGSLDERGYLTVSLEEMAEALGVDAAVVAPVLQLVQGFDPPGVAARDLRECLLLQLEVAGEGETLPARIVRDHLDDLLQKRFGEIARRMHLPQREVERALERIRKLDPRPGYRFATEPPPYITPDLVVDRVDDEFVTTLNDRHIPRLRISPSYQQVLRQARERRDGSREFLVKKLDAARWLIDIIEQRRRTMLKVMRDIVEFQHDFFEHGLPHLKPMTLNQVAERIGMHESTVSRVTRGKYVQTPHGVFELKYFFSPALRTESGGEVSARKVKQRLQALVTGENPHEPLSDQELVELLRREGYRVARRTVAKYREQLQILPARMRRQP